jgi:uncharacterized Ntn-hydrolase superfamily protein
VGAVATQSFVEPAYGPRGLERLRAGEHPADALAALVAADEGRATRQVGMVDARGRAAAHTGARCIAEAGHHVGDGYAVQANMMASAAVWPAMARAFERATGDLAERLLAALDAAEAAGGDVRGRQSAALLVVRGTPMGKAWVDRRIDVRVDDHPAPLVELRRLLGRARAYEHMNAGDGALERGDFVAAGREYRAAATLVPEEPELPFWHAVALAAAGRVDEALPLLGPVLAADPRWRTLLARLPAAGVLPDDPALLARLLQGG